MSTLAYWVAAASLPWNGIYGLRMYQAMSKGKKAGLMRLTASRMAFG